MGVETALLFCAIRANEVLGTLSFTRDTRAGYEMALCVHRDGYRLSDLCLNAPAFVLDVTLDPARFGFVASCYTGAFAKATPKVRNKRQDRLHAADQ